MGRDIYRRRCSVTVAPRERRGRRWRGPELRISFTVEKTPTKKANSLNLTIYNLSESSRDFIRSGRRIQLRAGYKGFVQGVFIGTIKRVDTKSGEKSPDIKTTIEAGDGSKVREVSMNKSLPPGASGNAILESIKSAMKRVDISEGFQPAMREIADSANGVNLNGRPDDELDRLTEGTPYEWSIQDGQLELHREGEPVGSRVVVLSPDSGLKKVTPLKDEQQGDGIEAKAFLYGDILPNRMFRIEDSDPSGVYRSRKITHSGDTHGSSWDTTIQGRV